MTSGTLDAFFDVNRTIHGIPHTWFTSHGMTNKSDSAEGENPDGDSYNNLQEYVTGTDPTNPESYLRFNIGKNETNGGIELSIDPALTDRFYVVYHAGDLLSPTWLTNSVLVATAER